MATKATESYDRVAKKWIVRGLRSRAPRPGRTKTVPIASLLCGWDAGVPPMVAVRAGTSLAHTSTRVQDGPHAQLLDEWDDAGDALLEPERLWQTAYGRNASRVIQLTGAYFDATDASTLVPIAGSFVRAQAEGWAERPGASSANSSVRVRQVRDSDCYQVIDGHHRVAMAAHHHERTISVRVERPATRTPLQRHLMEMSWMSGDRELYQPIDHPDVEQWSLIRSSTDRMAMMVDHLTTLGLEPTSSSYLDVAACYGWFVAQFHQLGYEAHGYELDPLAQRLATDVYGLDADRFHVGEAVELLDQTDRTYSVVSCFSLLHHFALGKAEHTAEDLLRRLDEVTGTVLYFDTGQGTERWFRQTLSEWTPDWIADWLIANSTFTKVEKLGTDKDGVGHFADNYGRTLFALTR